MTVWSTSGAPSRSAIQLPQAWPSSENAGCPSSCCSEMPGQYTSTVAPTVAPGRIHQPSPIPAGLLRRAGRPHPAADPSSSPCCATPCSARCTGWASSAQAPTGGRSSVGPAHGRPPPTGARRLRLRRRYYPPAQGGSTASACIPVKQDQSPGCSLGGHDDRFPGSMCCLHYR